jgi:hypothetical protein
LKWRARFRVKVKDKIRLEIIDYATNGHPVRLSQRDAEKFLDFIETKFEADPDPPEDLPSEILDELLQYMQQN